MYFSTETMKEFVLDHVKRNASVYELEAIVNVILKNQPDMEHCVCYSAVDENNDDHILKELM